MAKIRYLSPAELKKKLKVKFRFRMWYGSHFPSKWRNPEPKRCCFGLLMLLFPRVPKLQIERGKFSKIWKRRYLKYSARISVGIFQLWSIDKAFHRLQDAYIVSFLSSLANEKIWKNYFSAWKVCSFVRVGYSVFNFFAELSTEKMVIQIL
jgi:hypothetical protein